MTAGRWWGYSLEYSSRRRRSRRRSRQSRELLQVALVESRGKQVVKKGTEDQIKAGVVSHQVTNTSVIRCDEVYSIAINFNITLVQMPPNVGTRFPPSQRQSTTLPQARVPSPTRWPPPCTHWTYATLKCQSGIIPTLKTVPLTSQCRQSPAAQPRHLSARVRKSSPGQGSSQSSSAMPNAMRVSQDQVE